FLGNGSNGGDGIDDVAARAALVCRNTRANQPCPGETRQDLGGGNRTGVNVAGNACEPLHEIGRKVHARAHSAAARAASGCQRYGSSCSLSGGWRRLLAKLQSVARLTPSTTSSACWSV